MSVPDEGVGADRMREHFHGQAVACDALGSPFTAALCRALPGVLDEATTTGRRILSWQGDLREDALSLRLCGGLHALVLSGADNELAAAYPPAALDAAALGHILPAAISRNDAALGRALDSAPQTNEIARSAMVLPGFLTIARETGLPLDICEIGSSAGLNLLFDRFSYDFGGKLWGDPASPVRLAPDLRGDIAPPLDGTIAVAGRVGSDIRPIDIAVPAARLRLRSYVWADQTLRLSRLDAAISLAKADPFTLEHADAAAFVRRRFAGDAAGTARVLFHSIMWQYLPDTAKQAVTSTLLEAGATATPRTPIAWLRMEPLDTRNPYATLSLTLWPGGETRHLARCDYHGRWIEWLAA
jgi:hypothetical protein